jgi:hypothetical protein
MNAAGVSRRFARVFLLILVTTNGRLLCQTSPDSLDISLPQIFSDSAGSRAKTGSGLDKMGALLDSGNQHFYCNTGYELPQCLRDIAVLKEVLASYPMKSLGDWTWILVRSQEWKSILARLNLDPNIAAFSYLQKRQTFLEEALMIEVPERTKALSSHYHQRQKQLLAFAVAHEMGHAICGDLDELKANRAAMMLQMQRPFSCLNSPP